MWRQLVGSATAAQEDKEMGSTKPGWMQRYEKALYAICSLLLIGLVVLVFQNVVSRYFFRRTDAYTYELTRLIFPWLVFLGLGIAYRSNSHLTITVFLDKLPPRLLPFLHLFGSMATGIFFLFVFFVGLRLSFMSGDQVTPSLGILKTWFHLSVPIGALFMVIYAVVKFMEHLREVTGRRRK